MALYHDQLDDFVELTLDTFKRRKWVDISLDNQHHIFASRMFKDKKTPEKGGVKLNWKVQTTNTGSAKDTGLYAVDTTNVVDLTQKATQEWSKQTVNFSYDVDEEEFQSDMETIVDEIKVREHSMYNDFFEHMEEKMWGTGPASPTADPRPPSGIPFWIQKNATEGFNGGDPTGWGSVGAGNLDSDTFTRWKNYTFRYVNVTRDDLIAKWYRACAFTYFKSPHNYPQLGGSGMADWAFYTTYSLLEPLERLLEGRNDNLGVDLAWSAGKTLFKGIPIEWVPSLEHSTSVNQDTTNPIYGVNWKVFRYFFQKNRNMIRHKPQKAPHQHTVRNVFMDNWGNFACYNRRLLFVGNTA